jgi:hypothetical protein
MNPMIALAALATTIEEVKEGPESSFYLPFMGQISLDTFQGILGVLSKMGICKVQDHYVTFTQPPVGSKGAQRLDGIRKSLVEV